MLVNLLQQIANSSQRQMVALVDAGCASGTEAIAKIAHYYNITQVCACLYPHPISIDVTMYFHRFPAHHLLMS